MPEGNKIMSDFSCDTGNGLLEGNHYSYFNKSYGVWTIDAISLVLVPIYRTSTCSFELLLLESSNFGQKRRFFAISTRV